MKFFEDAPKVEWRAHKQFATEEKGAASKRLAFRATLGASSKDFSIYLLLTSALHCQIELLPAKHVVVVEIQ